MRLIIKFIGGWFMIVATIALMSDVTTASTKQGGFISTSIAEHWQALNKPSLDKLETWITDRWPQVWDWGVQPVLQIPTWALLFLIGGLLFWSVRKRKRIQIFAN